MNGKNGLNKAVGIIAAIMILAGTAWLYGAGPLAKPAERQEASQPGASAAGLNSESGAAGGLASPQAEEGQLPAAGSPMPSPAAAATPSAGPEGSSGAAGAGAAAAGAEASTPPIKDGSAGQGGDGSPAPSEPPDPQTSGGTAAGTAKPQASGGTAAGTAKPQASGANAAGTGATKPPAGAASPAPKPKPSAPAAKPPQAQAVTISVTGSAKTGVILKATRVEAEEGDTVLDVLKKAARSRKMVVDYSGKGAAAYVSGIGNLYEFDEGAGSGWLFSVNGTFSSRSAGASKIKPGDEIRWVYTTDYGKDVGASEGDGGGKGSDE
ncbi:DUF4430 domain-containing protein [Paenibacillus humicus]|uniref:DUF4430 domain-containing protein n=1 Tax=Paenibacillus humicus TaxID=412861 RepID=UPI000FD9B912|nr:DUF4430 domain-containing protein [Paenibacillus humicus]